jgi:hypothetical protein
MKIEPIEKYKEEEYEVFTNQTNKFRIEKCIVKREITQEEIVDKINVIIDYLNNNYAEEEGWMLKHFNNHLRELNNKVGKVKQQEKMTSNLKEMIK